MQLTLRLALLVGFWLITSAFDWTNAGGDPYTGTRRAAIERSDFPKEVQELFLQMIAEDEDNERADRPEGIHYREELIPEDFQFDWTMFGKSRRESAVVARTSRWNPAMSRMARVYRVQMRTADGGREYILFFPKACLNPSGKTRQIQECVCPEGRPLCPTQLTPGQRRAGQERAPRGAPFHFFHMLPVKYRKI